MLLHARCLCQQSSLCNMSRQCRAAGMHLRLGVATLCWKSRGGLVRNLIHIMHNTAIAGKCEEVIANVHVCLMYATSVWQTARNCDMTLQCTKCKYCRGKMEKRILTAINALVNHQGIIDTDKDLNINMDTAHCDYSIADTHAHFGYRLLKWTGYTIYNICIVV